MRAKEAAGDLIRETDLLGRFARDVERAGLVGETVNAKIFFALTSRVFDRPVSIAIKGVSSGGKSFTVQIVLSSFRRKRTGSVLRCLITRSPIPKRISGIGSSWSMRRLE